MRYSFIAAILVSLCLIQQVRAQLPAGFIQGKIAEGLDPVRLTQSDDGRIFIAEKKGTVRIVKDGALLPDPFISINVDNLDERGLAGIVMDPDFGNNQYFYLYYAVPGENHNRVSRFKASGDFANPASETILIDFDGLWWQVHNGGSLAFGLDGKLYISVGDGANTNGGPQNLASTLGKVLRINSDGSIPQDNPFYNVTTGIYRSIYAMGFRNPFSLGINPVSGQIIVGDVGNNSYEELNNVIAGKNYGWPIIEGPIQPGQVIPENYQPPLYYYPHSVGCAVIGGSFYVPWVATFPQSYLGKYFFGDYCSGKIKVADPSTGEILETFASNIKSMTHVFVAHDGTIYYTSRGSLSGGQEGNTAAINGSLWRIQYTGTGVPFVSDHPHDILLPEGETATFAISASGTNPLTYQWFKNGNPLDDATESTYITPIVSLSNDGDVYSCQVTNTDGQVMSDDAVLSVTSNTRPVVTIQTPAIDYTYSAGDLLSLKGKAIDNEDGQLNGSLLTWTVTFHHNDHTHPGLSPTTGATASFEIPFSGETSPNVYYEISLTASDSEGLIGRQVLNIQPKKSTMTFKTSPTGLSIKLDGQSITTPLPVEGVERAIRSVEAPPVLYDDDNMYRFAKWSDDVTDNPITIYTPEDDSTITAFYTTLALGDGTGIAAEFFNNQDKTFTGTPTMTRVDPNIDFDWAILSPEPGIIDANHFTVRWSGYLKVPFDGLYTFTLRTDDGSRLYFNDQLLIDNWAFTDFLVGSEKSGSKELKAGKMYRVKVEYFENQSLSFAKLFWSSDAIPKSIIPHNQFFLTNPGNKAPVASFDTPVENYKFGVHPFVVKATTKDAEEGLIDPRKFTWTVEIHHDDHVHELVDHVTGLDSLLVAIPADHDDKDIEFYRVIMDVSDPEGLATSISKDIYPNIVSIAVNTKPVGIPYKWNSQQMLDNQLSGLQGSLGILQATQQVVINETIFKFFGWEGDIIPFFASNTTILEMANGTILAVYNGQPKATFVNADFNQKLIHGNPVVFKGSGFDIEDDVMTPQTFSWHAVIFDSTMHPDTLFTADGVDTFNWIPDLTSVKDVNSFGRIFFTVTDSRGAKTTISTDLQLSLANVNLAASMENVSITIDGSLFMFPYTFSSINATPHSYLAQPWIIVGDDEYEFDSWSNGSFENPLVFVTPPSDTTLTANYRFGVNLGEAVMGVKVYPNPVVNQFVMQWGPRAGYYILADALGRSFSTGDVEVHGTLKLDLAEKGAGLYYLKITVDSQTRVIKLLKR